MLECEQLIEGYDLMAKPFLRWAGGKSKLAGKIASLLGPDKGRGYFEPFLGGGGVFFALEAKRAVLSDVNPQLIAAYKYVRDDVEGLIKQLDRYVPYHNLDPAAFYADMRHQYRMGVASGETAMGAHFIYLNRACFNGLHRVNLKGEFNSPIGKSSSGDQSIAFDYENLRECSKALKDAVIVARNYRGVLAMANAGDRVYLDPPYSPVDDQKSNFTAYAGTFNQADHIELTRCAKLAVSRGATVVLSNAETDWTVGLYAGLKSESIGVQRNISANTTKRVKARELLISFG